jgi:DNA-binding XRE family transcriptional regulator
MVGDIPERILNALRNEYGDIQVVNDDDDELVNVIDTDWYQTIKATMTPGKTLKAYRERAELTQQELGHRIGNVPRQHISGMELDRRPIGREMAKRLGKALNADYKAFL